MIKCCKISKEWKISHISSIYKKGDRRDPKNHRGISVNGTLSRLFTKILQKILQKECIEKIDENQSGLVPGRYCVDNLFIIHYYCTYMEINGTMLKILKECYTDNVAYVEIENELSDPIEVTKSLRRGCSLSPILFNIYVEKSLDH